jgi:hypothetical protein
MIAISLDRGLNLRWLHMVLSRFVRPVLSDPLKKDWVSGEAIFFKGLYEVNS